MTVMVNSKYVAIALALLSGVALAVEPVSNPPSSQAGGAGAQQKFKQTQRGPIVGSMIEDGREVPVRFRGIETKEQKARHQQEEQKQKQQEAQDK